MGLGNPGKDYAATRHNVGKDAVEALADRLGGSFKAHKVKANVADTVDAPGGTPVSLLVPHGYYNTSGGPVQAAMAFYKVDHERLIVVHDDLDLEVGRIRLKRGGGTAGNKGLADIAQRAGGPEFLRVRIGIGRPPGHQAAKDYVLKRFAADQRELADGAVVRAGDAVLDLVTGDLETAQNRHHPQP